MPRKDASPVRPTCHPRSESSPPPVWTFEWPSGMAASDFLSHVLREMAARSAVAVLIDAIEIQHGNRALYVPEWEGGDETPDRREVIEMQPGDMDDEGYTLVAAPFNRDGRWAYWICAVSPENMSGMIGYN